ncbi:hypothetical protein BCR44DRAFT_1423806 [Catenaria anguillulae PL171]|uniref:Secreted protein n=1 Tax=Catenaria anguillulae PL171 TaxID=765915 RepID=A0A1Y2I1R5_9FUNG|nr:hypothetical protein BCR44DRAFT_1423806 [Catenaria anguillulae PL171]
MLGTDTAILAILLGSRHSPSLLLVPCLLAVPAPHARAGMPIAGTTGAVVRTLAPRSGSVRAAPRRVATRPHSPCSLLDARPRLFNVVINDNILGGLHAGRPKRARDHTGHVPVQAVVGDNLGHDAGMFRQRETGAASPHLLGKGVNTSEELKSGFAILGPHHREPPLGRINADRQLVVVEFADGRPGLFERGLLRRLGHLDVAALDRLAAVGRGGCDCNMSRRACDSWRVRLLRVVCCGRPGGT